MRHIIHIFLWGEEIGALEWKPQTGRSFFTYNPAYINKGGVSIAPLIAPMDKDALYRSFGSEEERIFQRLPSFWLIPCRMTGVIRCLSIGVLISIWLRLR